MTILFWLVVTISVAALAGVLWYVRRRIEDRRVAEEARVAAFVSDLGAAVPISTPKPAPVQAPSPPAGDIGLQKLLFDSAQKAGEAGEPAIAIQLYARLLARYPATAFANLVREAVEVQKKKLAR